ncbi:MAG TPA: 6-pyruvoyl-tetrahydropterin synthase-related protein [Thermoanaerobaculia bacterium]|nr:6-pyruvoyl-tetrahydropterin synthase-related protein [Thermoanaerobaculia bacterium]
MSVPVAQPAPVFVPWYRTRVPRPVLALDAALLAGTLLAWLVLDPIKYLVAGHLRQGGTLREGISLALGTLGPLAWTLGALALALLVLVAVWEARGRELSRALTGSTGRSQAVLLAGVLLWLGHSYLYPGYLLSGDSSAHVVRIAYLAESLREGQLPSWNNYQYLGAPFLQFTGPLLFWLGAPLTLALGDPTAGTKLLLFALFVLGGFAFYRLCRDLGLSRAASLLGAVAYSGSFAHLHVVLIKGNLPQAIVLAVFPLALLFMDRVGRDSRPWSPSWAGLAICLAALAWNHQPTALIAGLFLAAFALGCLLGGRYGWARVVPLGTAALAGVVLSLAAVVPILAERKYVAIHEDPSLLFWFLPDLSFAKKLLLWNFTRTGQGFSNAAYLGLSVVALVLAGALRLRHRGRSGLGALTLTTLACVLLSLTLRGEHVREILFILFFVALAAALGADFLLSGKREAGHLPALAFALVLVDLSSTSVQPLARADKGYLDEARSYLARTSPTGRVLLVAYWDGELEASVGMNSTPLFYGRVPDLVGPHPMTATRVHNSVAVVIKAAERDLEERGELSPFSRQMLSMFHATRLVADSGKGMGFPPEVKAAREEGPLGRAIALPEATPVVFSSRLALHSPPEGIEKPFFRDSDFHRRSDPRIPTTESFVRQVHQAMAWDEASGFAAVLPVQELPREARAVAAKPERWKAGLLSYRMDRQTAALVVRSERPGWVQVSHPWHPDLRITRNGSPVRPLRGSIGLMILPLKAGLNRYEIVAERSRLRTAMGWFSATALLGVAVLGFAGRRLPANLP